MSLVTIHLIVVGSVLGYILIAGFAYAVCPSNWKHSRAGEPSNASTFAAFWPVLFICWIVYFTALCGPRFVEWYAERRRQRSIPKATVHKG